MTSIEIARRLGRGELSLDSVDAQVDLDVDDLSKLVAAESADVRAGAAILLSRTETESGMEPLFLTLLEDSESRVVAVTLWALEERPEIARSCIAPVLRCFENSDWKIRLPAMTALGSVARDGWFSVSANWASIIEQAISDDCEAIRSESATLLGCSQLTQESFETLLRQFFMDDSFDVRRSTLGAVIRRSPPFESVAWVIELGLCDASYDVRIEACRLAGRYSEARVLFAEVLRELVDSSDEELSAAAEKALFNA